MATHTEIEHIKANVKAMEDALSTWSGEVVALQTMVTNL